MLEEKLTDILINSIVRLSCLLSSLFPANIKVTHVHSSLIHISNTRLKVKKIASHAGKSQCQQRMERTYRISSGETLEMI